jgi:hypothetical protein
MVLLVRPMRRYGDNTGLNRLSTTFLTLNHSFDRSANRDIGDLSNYSKEKRNMKVGEDLKKIKCDPEGVCSALSWSVLGTNGRSKGINNNMYLKMNKPVGQPIRSQITYVVDPKCTDKENVSALLINYCPFCGTAFTKGWPSSGGEDESNEVT